MPEDAYTTYVRKRRRQHRLQRELEGLKTYWLSYALAALVVIVSIVWPHL